MKNKLFILSVCILVFATSCIKELIEEELNPTVEDNTAFFRTHSIFGFNVNASGCTVNQSVTNSIDSSFFTYYKAGGLKQVIIGKEGSKIDYSYDIDGRLQFVLYYDDESNVKKMEFFYTTDKTRMRRVEISSLGSSSIGGIDTIFAEYPANANTIILYSATIKEGKNNATSVCHFDTDGNIKTIERGFRNPDTKIVDVDTTEIFEYDTSVINPYFNNVHADYLALMATKPTAEVADKATYFLSRNMPLSHNTLGSTVSFNLSNQVIKADGTPEKLVYKDELNNETIYDFDLSCK